MKAARAVTVQRLAAPGASAEAPAAAAPGGARARAGALLVDDGATPGPGQMRKSDFLAALRPRVCAVADAELARAGRNTEGCPYLDRWFSYYARTDAGHAEAALLRFAPQAAAATTASDYLPAVAERVRRAVARWADTGEVPAAIAEGMGGGVGGGVLGALTASGGVVGAVAGLASGVASLFTKGPDREPAPGVARAVQSRLRGGQPLPSAVRSGMERALGHDFSRVRIHTDAGAAALSSRLDARAFTVGTDVAFAAGQWQPGTPVGDAVLAHELSHVVQQGYPTYDQSAGPAFAQRQALEDDADHAAAGAVARLWDHDAGALPRLSFTDRLKDIKANAGPRLRSGLRLQRCGASQAAKATAPGSQAEPPRKKPTNREEIIDAAQASRDEKTRDVRAVALVNDIIDVYFPADRPLVAEVVIYKKSDRNKSLETEPVRRKEGMTQGRILVSPELLTRFTGEPGEKAKGQLPNFARIVSRVDHELEHIRQYRGGLLDKSQRLREFLAYKRQALQADRPELGRIRSSTRYSIINAAIGEYYCLEKKEQEQYAGDLKELQAEWKRQEERWKRTNPGEPIPPQPTTCTPTSGNEGD